VSESPLESQIKRKEIIYKDPKVKIGNGKLGPVDLIIYKDELFALKRIPKKEIDKQKRIEHIKSEKNVLLMLKQLREDIQNGIYKEGAEYQVNFNFDDIYLNKDAQVHLDSTMGTSQRNSYMIDDDEPLCDPLNYIVMLEDTFSDHENVNFIFEYLPGQDLFWLIQN